MLQQSKTQSEPFDAAHAHGMLQRNLPSHSNAPLSPPPPTAGSGTFGQALSENTEFQAMKDKIEEVTSTLVTHGQQLQTLGSGQEEICAMLDGLGRRFDHAIGSRHQAPIHHSTRGPGEPQNRTPPWRTRGPGRGKDREQ